MSTELKRDGTIVGSANYFFELNNRSGLTKLFATPKGYAYDEVIIELGKKAERTVGTIYEDYREYAQYLRYFPERERKQVIDLVNGLCELAEMSGNSVSKQSDLLYLLALNASDTRANSSASVSEIEETAESIANGRYVSASRGMELAKLASERDFLEIKDEVEGKMMELLFDGKSKEFVKDALVCAKYRLEHSNYTGKCGYELGSDRYIEWVEKQVFGDAMNSRVGDKYQYAAYMKKLLSTTRDWIREDLEQGERKHDYITDESADLLKRAVQNLEKCKIDCYNLTEKVEQLAWFVGGNPSNIMKLQAALREFDFGRNVEIDGVYGSVTNDAWNRMLEMVRDAEVPRLYWEVREPVPIDQFRAENYQRARAFAQNMQDIFNYADHGVEAWKKSFEIAGALANPTDDLGRAMYNAANKKFVISYATKEAAKYYKGFTESVQHTIKVSGKTLAVTGILWAAIDAGLAVHEDLTDADKKLEKPSVKVVVGAYMSELTAMAIMQWAGGAEIGATIGGCFGPVPAAVGAVVVPIILSIAGSTAMSSIAEWVVDVTELTEERYGRYLGQMR